VLVFFCQIATLLFILFHKRI